MSEGGEHPTLRWLAKGDKHDWTNAVAEISAYNRDFQVRQLHAYVAGPSLGGRLSTECFSMFEWRQMYEFLHRLSQRQTVVALQTAAGHPAAATQTVRAYHTGTASCLSASLTLLPA